MRRSDTKAKNTTTTRIIETQIYDCLMLTKITEAFSLGVVVVIRMEFERLLEVAAGALGSWTRGSLRVNAFSDEEMEFVTKLSK